MTTPRNLCIFCAVMALGKRPNIRSKITRQRLFNYLTSLPADAPIPTRRETAEAVGIKERQLAEYLKPEFWEEVLEVRRRNTARVKMAIDTALYREACKGNIKAIKLF